MLRTQQCTVLAVVLFYLTSLLRLANAGLRAYHMCSCSLDRKTVYECGRNDTSFLSLEAFDFIQISSWYIEVVTLLIFIVLLAIWPAYRFSMLFEFHLWRTSQTFSVGTLVIIAMALEFGAGDEGHIRHHLHTVWILGFELEMALYLVASILVVHVNSFAIREAVIDQFRGGRYKQGFCFGAWWSFLVVSAIHNFTYAAYDAMVLANSAAVGKSYFKPDYTLLLLTLVALRLILGKTFFEKFLDWPLPDGLNEERRVHWVLRPEYTAL